jgi:hypothetical protein
VRGASKGIKDDRIVPEILYFTKFRSHGGYTEEICFALCHEMHTEFPVLKVDVRFVQHSPNSTAFSYLIDLSLPMCHLVVALQN